MVDLERIETQVKRGRTVEEAVGKFDWKEFENIIGNIFRQNEFRIRKNFRFKTKRRYEIDVIASRGDMVFCVDCKRWSQGRDKRWSLGEAAKEQETRANQFKKFVQTNPIARGMMKIPDVYFVPMMVTLYQEEILKKGKTFVVPVKKLNSFILDCESIVI